MNYHFPRLLRCCILTLTIQVIHVSSVYSMDTNNDKITILKNIINHFELLTNDEEPLLTRELTHNNGSRTRQELPDLTQAVFIASWSGDLASLQSLTQSGWGNDHFMQKDYRGRTPLHYAVISPFWYTRLYNIFYPSKTLDHLFAVGIQKLVNTRDNTGSTALHLAAEAGNLVAVSRLLSHLARADILDNNNRTALVRALVALERLKNQDPSNPRIVSFTDAIGLITNFIHPNRPTAINSSSGNLPLHVVSKQGHYLLALNLILHGADPRLPNAHGDIPAQVIIKAQKANDERTRNVLHFLEDQEENDQNETTTITQQQPFTQRSPANQRSRSYDLLIQVAQVHAYKEESLKTVLELLKTTVIMLESNFPVETWPALLFNHELITNLLARKDIISELLRNNVTPHHTIIISLLSWVYALHRYNHQSK